MQPRGALCNGLNKYFYSVEIKTAGMAFLPRSIPATRRCSRACPIVSNVANAAHTQPDLVWIRLWSSSTKSFQNVRTFKPFRCPNDMAYSTFPVRGRQLKTPSRRKSA